MSTRNDMRMQYSEMEIGSKQLIEVAADIKAAIDKMRKDIGEHVKWDPTSSGRASYDGAQEDLNRGMELLASALNEAGLAVKTISSNTEKGDLDMALVFKHRQAPPTSLNG